MAKFSMGKAPTDFQRSVLIDMHDGTQDHVTMTFIYRTRTDYAKLVDETILGVNTKPGKNKPAVEEDPTAPFSLQSLLSKQDDASVDFVLKIAKGWDLSDEFNKANLKEMKDRFPGAIEAIVEAYRVSILEGRLKN